MEDELTISIATHADDAVAEEIRRLLPQLSQTAMFDREILNRMLENESVDLFLARLAGRVVGMATLVTFPIPTGVRGHIDDVVVDELTRGRGGTSPRIPTSVGQAVTVARGPSRSPMNSRAQSASTASVLTKRRSATGWQPRFAAAACSPRLLKPSSSSDSAARPKDWAWFASSGTPMRAMSHPLALPVVSVFNLRGHFGSVLWDGMPEKTIGSRASSLETGRNHRSGRSFPDRVLSRTTSGLRAQMI